MKLDREVSGPRDEAAAPVPRNLRCVRGHKLGELFENISGIDRPRKATNESLLLKIRCRRCKRDMNFSLTDDCGTDIDL